MSYRLDNERLKEMISKIEGAAQHHDDALCRVFAFLNVFDIYTMFTSKQHADCLRYLEQEVGMSLNAENVTFAGSLELMSDHELMLLSGGSSLGREYRNDGDVTAWVLAQLGQMVNAVHPEYQLR